MRIRVEVGKSCSGSGSNVLVLVRRGCKASLEREESRWVWWVVHAKDLNWV
jgi:hypothetical protein